MKEYFIVSDVHSFYDAMIKALVNNGFDENNPNHIIISCGDLFDRGKQAKKVLDFFYKLYTQKRCILVSGNHDDLFYDMIQRQTYFKEDIHNGTLMTLAQLQTQEMNILDVLNNFPLACKAYDKRIDELRENSINYIEFKNHIFVHGWIPLNEIDDKYIYDPKWRLNTSLSSWEQSRWLNGMEMQSKGFIDPCKTIICGHWHASWGYVRKNFKSLTDDEYKELEFSNKNFFKPFYDTGIIAIDSCVSFTGFCNCLHFSEGEI